jgi:hypothetical protein
MYLFQNQQQDKYRIMQLVTVQFMHMLYYYNNNRGLQQFGVHGTSSLAFGMKLLH